jgi:hypothetical protein
MKRPVSVSVFGAIVLILAGLLISGCNSSMKKDNGNVVEEWHVYIAFGQSNMQGPGIIRAQDTENISDRYRILNVVADRYAGEDRAAGQWYKAVPPLIIPDSNLTHWTGSFTIGLSPADYFGRTLAENTPEHITIGVVAVAHGDMALAAFHKTKAEDYYNREGTVSNRPSDTEMQGMNRYKNAGYANMYDAIIRNAKIAQQAGPIKGIIVHQGESGPGLSGAAWTDLLKEIYDDILADLGLAPNSIPILLGQTWNGGSGYTGGALASDSVIQNVLPNAWIVSSVGCTGRTGQGQPDNVHFGSEGLQLLGTRYGEKMLELNY